LNNDLLTTWVEGYVRAWETNDPADIGRLFADDARYFTAPHRQPLRGRDAIVADWLERKDDPGTWSFSWEILAVAGDLGFVQGRTDYVPTADEPAHAYSNLWVIRLDAGGRCVEFTEWWIERE
jgi:ketosteroid isomerase-like protein